MHPRPPSGGMVNTTRLRDFYSTSTYEHADIRATITYPSKPNTSTRPFNQSSYYLSSIFQITDFRSRDETPALRFMTAVVAGC